MVFDSNDLTHSTFLDIQNAIFWKKLVVNYAVPLQSHLVLSKEKKKSFKSPDILKVKLSIFLTPLSTQRKSRDILLRWVFLVNDAEAAGLFRMSTVHSANAGYHSQEVMWTLFSA